MSTSKYLTKVAIVGAGGNSGKFMTQALLGTGKHTVTALTRHDSTTKLPDGVKVAIIDYSKPVTLVAALEGQDVLVITLSGHSAKGTEAKLVEAAAEAGVPWILPNEWSPDSDNKELVKDVSMFQSKVATRQLIADLGKSSYISVCTGFWYEWLLPLAPAFGIDFANRTALFFDEGETKISLSTWPQVGRAVAALLSLPIHAESTSDEACLDSFENKVVYINSFTVNQKEMLESAIRVTKTEAKDWKITKQSSHGRYQAGVEEIKEGKRIGFMKMMCTRVFYPDGCGDFEHGKGTLNKILNLSQVDLDEATQVAFERSKLPNWLS